MAEFQWKSLYYLDTPTQAYRIQGRKMRIDEAQIALQEYPSVESGEVWVKEKGKNVWWKVGLISLK